MPQSSLRIPWEEQDIEDFKNLLDHWIGNDVSCFCLANRSRGHGAGETG